MSSQLSMATGNGHFVKLLKIEWNNRFRGKWTCHTFVQSSVNKGVPSIILPIITIFDFHDVLLRLQWSYLMRKEDHKNNGVKRHDRCSCCTWMPLWLNFKIILKINNFFSLFINTKFCAYIVLCVHGFTVKISKFPENAKKLDDLLFL